MNRYMIVIPAKNRSFLLKCDEGDGAKLETLQKLVSGDVETVPSALDATWAREEADRLVLLVDEEGRLKCKAANQKATQLAPADVTANGMLKVNNIDPSVLGSYSTALYKNNNSGSSGSGRRSSSSGGSSGSRSSGSSGGSSGSRSSPTYAQLLSMSKEFVTMKASDPRYDYYKRTLTDAGWIKDDTPNLLETNRGLTGQSWKGDPANKWGTGTSNRQSQSTGRTASQSSVPQRAQVAANAIKGQRNHGSDDQTIFDSLKYQGYTDDEIWKAFELAG